MLTLLQSVLHRPCPLSNLSLEKLLGHLAAQPRPPEVEAVCGKLPPSELQAQFTGLSAKETFRQALTYLDACRDAAQIRGRPWGRSSARVLDFGCGWGRITQLLGIYFNPSRIIACDVQPEAVELCRANGVRATYELLSPWPPSRQRDESVDFVFAYSVFSHLSEDNADAWAREFARILRPGGMAFLTTRHRSFFDYLEELHRKADEEGTASFAHGAARSFRNIAEARARYDVGEFCFDGQGAGGPGLTAVYGEAFIPHAWARRRWGGIFSAIDYLAPKPAGLLDQATLVLSK